MIAQGAGFGGAFGLQPLVRTREKRNSWDPRPRLGPRDQSSISLISSSLRPRPMILNEMKGSRSGISSQEQAGLGSAARLPGAAAAGAERHRHGLDAALKIGAAGGSDLAVLSELLPAAEAVLVEALSSDRVRDDGP